MRSSFGCIRQIGEDHWEVSFEAPRGADGRRHRPSKRVRGTRHDAEAVLARMLLEHGTMPDTGVDAPEPCDMCAA